MSNESLDDVPPFNTGKTWEEMTVGSKLRTASRTVTETDLVNFVALAGFNEPLFYDAGHTGEGGYTGRLVPGALTYALAEGLVIQSHTLHGTGLAFLHMELDVRAPGLRGRHDHRGRGGHRRAAVEPARSGSRHRAQHRLQPTR